MTLNSSSSVSIGSQHISGKEETKQEERDRTGLLVVTIQGSCLMEIYASREAFAFSRDVISSTGRCTIVDKCVVIVLKRIMTPLFISLDMFNV